MNQKHFNKLSLRYPSIYDLKKKARKRLPHISWEYLDCGTGDERAVSRNIERLAAITLTPKFLKGEFTPNISTTLFGQDYQAPFGVAPIGLSGLIWPNSEHILARTAATYAIPYCLSTVAAETPETIGPLVGEMGWFQLYPPREEELRDDLLKRVKDTGFKTLLVTADVPIPSRRERLSRAGLTMPPQITPYFIYQGLTHPAWTLATLKAGLPRLKTMEKYASTQEISQLATFVGQKIGGTLSWDYLQEVRDQWEGPLILKGILHPDDAEKAVQIGVDGIQVSNHGARQFDGAPAAIDALPAIVKQVKGKTSILFDSGIRSGLDIIRALSLGADFVLLGRPFLYGVAALGQYGGDYTVELLMADLKNNMIQLGYSTLEQIKSREGQE